MLVRTQIWDRCEKSPLCWIILPCLRQLGPSRLTDGPWRIQRWSASCEAAVLVATDHSNSWLMPASVWLGSEVAPCSGTEQLRWPKSMFGRCQLAAPGSSVGTPSRLDSVKLFPPSLHYQHLHNAEVLCLICTHRSNLKTWSIGLRGRAARARLSSRVEHDGECAVCRLGCLGDLAEWAGPYFFLIPNFYPGEILWSFWCKAVLTLW